MNQQQQRKNPDEGVQARLLAVVEEAPVEKPTRGHWLTKEMEKLGPDMSKEPTKEEIRLQLRLPAPDTDFVDPITKWEEITPNKDFRYSQEYINNLPDELDPNLQPPTPPRDVFSVAHYMSSFQLENHGAQPDKPVFLNRSDALEYTKDDDEEVTVIDNGCPIRVSRRALLKARAMEVRDSRTTSAFGSRGRGRDGGGSSRGRGGERGDAGRSRSSRNSNYEDLEHRYRRRSPPSRSKTDDRASRYHDHDRRPRTPSSSSYSSYSRPRDPSPRRSPSHHDRRSAPRSSSSSSRYDERSRRPSADDRNRSSSSRSDRLREGRHSQTYAYNSPRNTSPRRRDGDSSSFHSRPRDPSPKRRERDSSYSRRGPSSPPRPREQSVSSAPQGGSSTQPKNFKEYREMKARGQI